MWERRVRKRLGRGAERGKKRGKERSKLDLEFIYVDLQGVQRFSNILTPPLSLAQVDES